MPEMAPPSVVSARIQATAISARIRPYSASPWPSSSCIVWIFATLLIAQFLIFDMLVLLPLPGWGSAPCCSLPALRPFLPLAGPAVPVGALADPVAGLASASARPGTGHFVGEATSTFDGSRKA